MAQTRLADLIVDSTTSFDATTRQAIIETDQYVWDPAGLAWVKATQPLGNVVSTPYRRISTADTNTASIKAAAGTVYGWSIGNLNAAARYVKLYNKASVPVVGTDTPFLTLPIPGNTAGAGSNLALPGGIAFGTGIALAITANAADADATVIGAGDVILNVFYA